MMMERSCRLGRTAAALLLASSLSAATEMGPGCRSVAAAPLKPGTRLPNLLAGADLRNAPVGSPAPQGWVIYVLPPNCAACEKTLGEAVRLASSLPPEWAFLTAVPGKPEQVEPFLTRLGLTSPLAARIPQPTLAAFRIAGEPVVYVLDRDWRLLKAYAGPLDSKRAQELASRFKVALASGPKPPAAPSKPGNLCLDQQQAPYSRGAKAEALGLRFRCSPGGVWTFNP
jgi:hypothetical protein